jgi:hypothetical protein
MVFLLQFRHNSQIQQMVTLINANPIQGDPHAGMRPPIQVLA